MDIRIGIVNALSEIKLEMDDETSVDDVKSLIEERIAAGGGLVWLTDRKGRQTGFPVDRLAYVEVGTGDEPRIGFS